MKKNIIVSMAVLLLFASCLYASDGDELFYNDGSGNKIENGRYWQTLSPQSRICYISGLTYGIGIGAGAIINEYKLTSEDQKKRNDRVLSETATTISTYNEIVEYIDDVYKDPLNRPAPIHDIYTCLVLEQIGWLKKENREEAFRRIANKYGKQP